MPAATRGLYSLRNATNGSTREARRAGTKAPNLARLFRNPGSIPERPPRCEFGFLRIVSGFHPLPGLDGDVRAQLFLELAFFCCRVATTTEFVAKLSALFYS